MRRWLLWAVLLPVMCVACHADVPRIVYDAAAVDAAGAALPDGVYRATFRVYADPVGGKPAWSETIDGLTVEAGRLRVELGRLSPLDLDWQRAWYVSMELGPNGERSPRTQLYRPDGRSRLTSASSDLAYLVADAPLYEAPDATCDESIHPGGNWGANIGSFEDVIAYSNGADTGSWSSLEPYCQDGYEYQCVEYIRRFYRLHLGMNTSNWHANGNQFYGYGPTWGLEQHPNNGTELPVPDDILCFNSGTYGHVAIVVSATSSTVRVIEQNVSSTNAFRNLSVTNGIVYNSTCQGWLHKPGNGTDPTAPVISGVQATGISHNSAAIQWTTDDVSSSVVDYGLTSSYGQTATSAGYTTSHTVPLTGLSANTLYHYSVRSTNGSGLTSYSGDYTFSTTPAVPGQPVVTVVSGTSLSVANNASDSASSYYAFRINDGSACSNKFVQSDGTVGSSPVWRTKSAWGTTTVTGLTPGTSYTFDVAAAGDASGSNRTSNRYGGSYVNTPTLGVANKWASGDTAAGFNGTNEYVSLPPMGFNVNLSAGFTIECWAKPSALSTWYPVIQLTDSSSYGTFVNHICFDIGGTSGVMRGEIYQSGGCGNPCYGNYYVSGTHSFTAGSWNHYAMVVSSGGTLTFYKNGVADSGQSVLYMPSSGVTRGKVQIGRRDTGSTYYWNGSLDEVAVYSSALSTARIQAHYNAPDAARYNTEVIKDNPVAYWRLGETSGTAAADNKGGYGPSASQTTLTCTNPVAPTSASANPTAICSGASSTLTATGGSGDYCRWYAGSCGGALVGTGTSIAVTPTSSTTYYARWENACGSSTCVSVTVTVNTAPSIGTQPMSQTKSVGQSVTFTVAASGGGTMSYQWRKDGSDISEVTDASYTIDSVTTADSGSYDCLVTNTCGSATSNAAVLTISSQSASTVVAAKALADGTAVTLLGPVVTGSFGSFYYVEDPNRASGIKVITAGAAPATGAMPSILAQLATQAGERVLDHAIWSGTVTGTVPKPLGISNAAAAQALPWGLLVTVWGRASVPPGATDTFTISDGSPVPIIVRLYGMALPEDGSFVVYTGALGAGPTLHVIQPAS